MKLAIISHTEHYKTSDGKILGWGPTIHEINHLAEDFEEIFHIAFLHSDNPPPSSLPYAKSNIHFIPLKPVGGKGLREKVKILTSIPEVLRVMNSTLKQVDVFQLRTPTGFGVYLIPYLSLFSKKKGWYKYAGNWNQQNPPLGYRLQRAMLKLQKRKVTINGKWPHQPTHCLTFENPCLTEAERGEGLAITQSKKFVGPFTFCFVGRLEDAKGVERIIEAFGQLKNLNNVAAVHFVGNGPKMEHYKNLCETLGIPAVFHGFLDRAEVFRIYKKSHFFLLPTTASEGFPKVIAEAMNFGCLPIVSQVSSIGQYVNAENGFTVEPCTSEHVKFALAKAMASNEPYLLKKTILAHKAVFQFTFEHYKNRIQNELI